jgi:hypothetical protein
MNRIFSLFWNIFLLERWLFCLELPEEFNVRPGDAISLDIRNMEDISVVTKQIHLLCNGASVKFSSEILRDSTALICTLCAPFEIIEELNMSPDLNVYNGNMMKYCHYIFFYFT